MDHPESPKSNVESKAMYGGANPNFSKSVKAHQEWANRKAYGRIVGKAPKHPAILKMRRLPTL